LLNLADALEVEPAVLLEWSPSWCARRLTGRARRQGCADQGRVHYATLLELV
jgi:hypothetical protein